ncbi:MAG: GTPase KRas precursor [Candidatus Heimdallarchaeota archaeon LC_3]|nr:MAG: GTPase KRas precursor [Candidatus Heimdallarchaeota archaeon LC_3]
MEYKLVLCGDGAVGKTAIRNRYLGQGFNEAYLLTLGADFSPKAIKIMDDERNEQRLKFQIWDLAGQDIFSAVRPRYYKGANAAILVYDISRLSTYENILDWIAEIRKYIPDIASVILLANKIDLRPAITTAISNKEGKELARTIAFEEFEGRLKIPFFETSAKTGENVEEAFQKMAEETYRKYAN